MSRPCAAAVALALLMGCSGPAGIDKPDPQREEAAVQALEKLGATITRDDTQPGKPVVEVGLTGDQRLKDAAVKELHELKALQKLNLCLMGVTASDLKELRGLKRLQKLNLGANGVTDAGLKELRELKGLQTLILSKTGVTDAGLKDLRELKGLETLDLSNNVVTDAGLKELRELKSLQWLSLDPTPVTNAGLKELHELKSLRKLKLWSTGGVTYVGLNELRDALPNCLIETHQSWPDFPW
jgi:hypothetical protein